VDPFRVHSNLNRTFRSFKVATKQSIKLPFTIIKDGVYIFRRKVPLDILEMNPARQKVIKKSTGSRDPVVAIPMIEKFNLEFEKEMDVLRLNPNAVQVSLAKEATELAKKSFHKVGYKDDAESTEADVLFDQISAMIERGEAVSPKLMAVFNALNDPHINSNQRLSDALDLYLKTHQNPSVGLTYDSKRAVLLFMQLVGDLPIVQIRRMHVSQYVEKRLESIKTTSLEREIASLRAIQGVAIQEWELTINNVFMKTKIPKLGHDVKPKTKLTLENWVELFENCKGTSLTHVIPRALWATGLRIAELTGMRTSDVVLSPEPDPQTGEKIPHILIEANDIRRLKNASSKRVIPLVGVSLDAFTELHKQAVDAGSEYLISKYARPKGADTASATVNKHISQFGGAHCHTLRHDLVDRLRAVGATNALGGSITGHSERSSEFATYGHGFGLVQKRDILLKVSALPTLPTKDKSK
jgi:integrase